MYACIQYIQVNIQEMCKINLPTTVYIIKNRLTLHAICGFISVFGNHQLLWISYVVELSMKIVIKCYRSKNCAIYY